MIEFNAGEWIGLDNLDDELLEALKPDAERAVFLAGQHFANEIKVTLTGKRRGRSYKVSKTGRLHVASAPGEPPAVLFDNLRGSVGHTDPKWEGLAVSSEVGPGIAAGRKANVSKAYARRMELGGGDSRGVYIAPRPYMEPTAMRVEPEIGRIMERAFT